MTIDKEGKLTFRCKVHILSNDIEDYKYSFKCDIKDIRICPLNIINPRICSGIVKIPWSNLNRINEMKEKGFTQIL